MVKKKTSLTFRAAVFRRDNNKCRHCGEADYYKLTIHHIVKQSERPDLRNVVDNGMVLCQNCHSDLHKKETRQKTKKGKEVKKYVCAYCGLFFKLCNLYLYSSELYCNYCFELKKRGWTL